MLCSGTLKSLYFKPKLVRLVRSLYSACPTFRERRVASSHGNDVGEVVVGQTTAAAPVAVYEAIDSRRRSGTVTGERSLPINSPVPKSNKCFAEHVYIRRTRYGRRDIFVGEVRIFYPCALPFAAHAHRPWRRCVRVRRVHVHSYFAGGRRNKLRFGLDAPVRRMRII